MQKTTAMATSKGKDGLSTYAYKRLITVDQSNSTDTSQPLKEFSFESQPKDSTSISYVEFACNGRYLACVQVRHMPKVKQFAAWKTLTSVSQLMLLKFVDKAQQVIHEQESTVHFDSDVEDDFYVVASENLKLIEVYCVTMSKDTTQIAIHGFSYNDLLRKPAVNVYEIINGDNDDVFLVHKARLLFDSSEILFARVTANTFFPTNDELLMTSVCNDFHSVTKTNYLDLWNTKSNKSVIRLNLIKECPRFQGYVSSMAVSADSKILAMVSSTINWQLVLCSIQEKRFGKIISLQELTYDEPMDHFATFSEFISNTKDYELLICTSAGELTKLLIDPKALKIKHIIFSTKMVGDTPGLSIAGFKYIPAYSICVFKMHGRIRFADIETGLLLGGFDFNEGFSFPACSCLAVSKDGMEISFIKTISSISVMILENRDISLKNLCRNIIIHLIPENKIPLLDLPETLTKYLLYGKC